MSRVAVVAAVVVGLAGAALAGGEPPAVGAQPASAPGAACPVVGRIVSGWGPREDGFHDGVDLAAPYGTPIRAVLAGTVTLSRTGDPGGYGQWINIRNAAGTQQYGHMRLRLVHTGQTVTAGQVIAEVGSEGSSTGPHLHLRAYPGPPTGRGTDPVPWLARHGIHLPC